MQKSTKQYLKETGIAIVVIMCAVFLLFKAAEIGAMRVEAHQAAQGK